MPHFTVYHAIKTDDKGRLSFGLDAAVFPNDFVAVAMVTTDDINAVFQLTNHIDHSWTENEGVWPAKGPHRSTSVGDVIVAADGLYVVAPFGLTKVTADSPPTVVEIPALYE